ncbi:MAG TPA: FISUMP domain-containing protein [Bacteroidales bacterium]|nr:FISUMP domain-containing protein [Bacteroidales bacterium]
MSLNTAFAQNDSIYVMKDGNILWQYKVTEIDSIIFYKPVIEEETSGTFVDERDNREYSWVKIGEQVWMAENLKYLPSVVGPGTGSNTEAYYYVYDYDGTNVDAAKATENYATYGVLYNWTAAMAGAVSSDANPSGVQGICPDGWHLPSDAEWTQLKDYLGENAGGKLKEVGTTHWADPNTGATNESGFTALPGGGRSHEGNFYDVGNLGVWWFSTEYESDKAWGWYLGNSNSGIFSGYGYRNEDYSIRCVRDN